MYEEEITKCPNNNGVNQALDAYSSVSYIENRVYQCSSLEYTLSWMERTSKCYEQKETVCYLFADGSYYHVSNSTSTTWIDGAKICNSLNGTLAPYLNFGFYEINILLNTANQYWIGGVSTYIIQAESGDSCLSVTRFDDQLVQPENCKANNSFICASDLMDTSHDINMVHNNSTQTTNSNAFTSSTHTPISPDSKVNIITNALTSTSHTPISQGSNVSFIIVLVIIACCLAIIAVGYIISHVYMRKKNSNTERNSSNISPQNIVMTDN